MSPSAASSAAPLAPRRPLAPARPRRVSGPVRAPARNAPSRRAGAESGGLLLGLLGFLETLSSHRLLDRLIRGRMWIGIVAFALIGIVTLQLGLLKLNSSIGHALEKESALQRENAALSIENSELAGGTRVESQAASLGMRLTGVGGLKFRESHARSDVPQAAATLKAPPQRAEASGGESASSASTPSSAAANGEGQTEPGSSSGGEKSSESSPAAASGEEKPAGEAASGAGGSSEGPAPAGGEPTAAQAPSGAGGGESGAAAGGGTAAPGG